MALLSWRVVHDGKTPPPGEVVRADLVPVAAGIIIDEPGAYKEP